MKGGQINDVIITQPFDTKLLPTRKPELLKLEAKVFQWY